MTWSCDIIAALDNNEIVALAIHSDLERVILSKYWVLSSVLSQTEFTYIYIYIYINLLDDTMN